MSGVLLPKSKVYDHTGRVCIPKPIRDHLGIEKGDELEWDIKNGKIIIEQTEGN